MKKNPNEQHFARVSAEALQLDTLSLTEKRALLTDVKSLDVSSFHITLIIVMIDVALIASLIIGIKEFYQKDMWIGVILLLAVGLTCIGVLTYFFYVRFKHHKTWDSQCHDLENKIETSIKQSKDERKKFLEENKESLGYQLPLLLISKYDCPPHKAADIAAKLLEETSVDEEDIMTLNSMLFSRSYGWRWCKAF